MTHEEMIRTLQDQVEHNRIDHKELEQECEKWNIDLHEDVLFPIDYNTCDRCGDYGDSEMDFLWVDGFEWEDDNPSDQALLKALAQEPYEPCAICWECVKELTKKGEQL